MKYAIAILALLLSGCSMSDEEVSAAVARCKNLGMEHVEYGRLWTPRITDVVCVPKRSE